MAQANANLIWKIADLLRGPYQPNQYGDVILPFTILRRLDCILEPTKDEVLAEYKKIAATKVEPGVLLKAIDRFAVGCGFGWGVTHFVTLSLRLRIIRAFRCRCAKRLGLRRCPVGHNREPAIRLVR